MNKRNSNESTTVNFGCRRMSCFARRSTYFVLTYQDMTWSICEIFEVLKKEFVGTCLKQCSRQQTCFSSKTTYFILSVCEV